MSWRNRKLDIDFIIDSGLLFHINHQVMHPLGLALTVRIDQKTGTKTWDFIDNRGEPVQTFDKNTLMAGSTKLRRFMAEFGNNQLETRRKKLGFGTQYVPQVFETSPAKKGQ